MVALAAVLGGAATWGVRAEQRRDDRLAMCEQQLAAVKGQVMALADRTEWWHTEAGGGRLHIVVLRRSFPSVASYDQAIATRLSRWPADP